jgi:hypothetical protein
VDALETVRTEASAFAEDVAAYEAAAARMGQTATAPDAGQELQGLRSGLETTRQNLGDPAIDDALRGLRGHAAALKKNARALQAMSFTMLVTTASAGNGIDISDVVEGLRSMAKEQVHQAGVIEALIDRVERARAEAEAAVARAMTAIEGEHPQHTAGADGTIRDSGVASVAADLSSGVAQIMPHIVACMQHPDAFAQRCDHVAHIVAELKTWDEKAGLDILAAAQLDDMRAELDKVQAAAVAALRSFSTMAVNSATALEQRLAADDRPARLRAARNAAEAARKAVEAVAPGTEEAVKGLGACADALSHLDRAMEELADMTADVSLSSVNADLSERRASGSTPGLRQISREVGDSAREGLTAIDGLKATLETLKAAIMQCDVAALSERLSGAMQRLDEAETALAAGAEAAEAAGVAQTVCAARLRSVSESATDAENRLAANALTSRRMEAMAMSLKEPMAEVACGDPKAGVWAMGLYTMEREREVHRRIFTAAASDDGKAAADSGTDEDPLAGVFF